MSNTGTVGVSRSTSVKVHTKYVAAWTDNSGDRRTKEFQFPAHNLKKDAVALRRAIAYRKKMFELYQKGISSSKGSG